MLTRRRFLETMLAAGAGIPVLKDDGLERLLGLARRVDGRLPAEVARDEDFWLGIQQAFTLDRTLINLNNGGVSPSPRVVQEAMRRYLEYSNTAPVYTMWQVLEPEIESVRRRLAASFGCDPEEMAITRNASEALEIVQLGLPLERGDEVLTTTQDYPRMLTTWHQRERREGIVVKEISFPVPPPSQDDLAERIERAITPKTRVIHVCHITNLTGQIFPVKRICQLGRARGIEVIAEALTFHEGIGPERKAARLRYLFQRWAKRLEKLPKVRILTPYDPAQSCGLASVAVEGVDVNKLVASLWDKYRIIVTPIVHKEFSCVRVTPNVYTTAAEIDRFGDVMEEVIRKGLPA